MVRCGACGSLLEVALHLPAEAPSEHLPTATSPSPRPPLAPAAQGLLAFHGGPGSGGSDLFFGEVSLSDLLTAGVDREGAPAPIMGESSLGPNTLEAANGGSGAQDVASADERFLEEVRRGDEGENRGNVKLT